MDKSDPKIIKRQKPAVTPDVEMDHEDDDQDFEEDFEGQFVDQEDEWISQEGEEDQEGQQQEENKKKEAFTGNNKKLGEGEHLQVVNRAYDMLYRTCLEWPCLSIDVIIGENPFETKNIPVEPMSKYPYEVITVQGTQSQNKNQLILAKMSKLHKTKYDDDSEDWEDEEDDHIDNDQEPEFAQATVNIKYAVNRVRTLNSSSIVAYWNENAEICISDLSKKYRQLKQGLKNNPKQQIVSQIFKSSNEGFALNWNPLNTGQLAAGNVDGRVTIISSQGPASWVMGGEYHYHKGSVQDLMFSPAQSNVLASCSVDGTLQLIDLNTMKQNSNSKANLVINAHSKDVNVLDWNTVDTTKVLTGSDDCLVKVWDLRFIKQSAKSKQLSQPLLCFKWHEEPITSVAFQPNDKSMMAVASEDNRITVWDLAVENGENNSQIPNELMFIHQGQQQIKEIRFHPIYYQMLISTASNGINVFKPCFSGPDEDDQDDNKFDNPIREDQIEDYLNKLSIK